MRYTEITKEVTTAMKDWGYTTDGITPDTSSGNGQVALTVAVVYPDGTVSPAEEKMYANSTTIFNYWAERNIGIIAPLNNNDYDIAKITVTDGTRTDSTTSNTWTSSSAIEWDKTTNAAGSEWYDETEVWNDTMGTEPVVNGAVSNITWSAKNTGKLVLIYLKPVHHESNLKVQWVDDSASGAIISSQEVVVAYDGNIDPITFLNGLKQSSSVQTGTITLDDDAYITNSSGVNQTFNKDITTIQGVAGQYTSGLYQYTGADISEDGKTLTLHYSLDSSNLSKQYVVDFGLPVSIPLTDLVNSSAQVSNVVVSSNASYSNGKITYTPSQVLNGIEAVTARVEYRTGSPTTFSIGFVPATTVYYEEGFLKLNGFTGGNKGTSTQAAEAVGNKQNNYGYDPVYAGTETESKVEPSNQTQATSTTYGDSAEFTFTGTGVDIYANSDAATGQLFVQVKNSNGSTVKMIQVKTAMLNGDTNLTQPQNVTGYNVPVVSLDLETKDTYTVILTHRKASSDATGDTVNIDGFRVYNTLGTSEDVQSVYKEDLEDNPSFIEVRDLALATINLNEYQGDYGTGEKIISQVYDAINNAEATSAILNDNENYTKQDLQDLIDNGPKNEIYLQKNQTLLLNLKTDRVAQIGLKALNAQTSYSINDAAAQTLNASTDMFYTVKNRDDATSTITITNTGEGILAITKLKICDAPADAIQPITEQNVTDALIGLGYVDATKYADATANINLVDYTGKILASTSLTANGEEGTEATFAAADIQTLAEQLMPEGYAFVDVSAITDQTVVCGESADINVQIGKVATLNVTYKTLFGKTAGTATLTAVQTSSASSYTFSASEIREAAPSGFWTGTLISTKVKYGSTGSRTVIGF